MQVVLNRRTTRAGYVGMSVGIAALLMLGGPAVASASASSVVPATAVSKATSASKKAVSEKFDAQVSESGKYMRTSSDGSVYFDTTAARAAGASAEILDIGQTINQLASAQDTAGNGAMAARLSLPIWGNWCGPGHGAGPALDVLDSICRKHDRCYGSRGYFACSCDRAIVSEIRQNAHRMKTRERATAAAVSTYFTYCLCNPLK